MNKDKIIIKGARVNNLKNINVEIPRDQLVIMTGLSGSGKTSLAFDTIYAEGQRRYVESLSAYARQFLGGIEKPDVDSIDGLSPAIAIDQKTTSNNPRSTVGTVTEIFDYLRLLYARVGHAYCPTHHVLIESQTIKQMVDTIDQYEDGTKLQVLARMCRNQKGTHKDLFEQLVKDGFLRVKVDGEMRLLDEDIVLDKNKKHNIDVVVDRIIKKEGYRSRLADSLETGLKLTGGEVIVENLNEKTEKLFSQHLACPYCGFSVPKLEPRLFSFNNPLGACPTCGGIGLKSEVAEDLLVPNMDLTLNQGAIAFLKGSMQNNNLDWQQFKYVCLYYGIPMDVPYRELTQEQRKILLRGSGDDIEIPVKLSSGHTSYKRGFEGIANRIERLYPETESEFNRRWYRSFLRDHECPTCHGARLNEKVLSIRIGGLNINDVCQLPLNKLYKFFDELTLTKEEEQIASLVLKEIKRSLSF